MSERVLHEWTTESGRHFRLFENGDIWLDKERGRMLLSGWEPAFARELHALAARVAELEAENAKLRKSSDLALSLAEEFERAVASREPVRGMQVSPSSDFLACAQLPSAVKRMAWWAREIRAARAEVDK